MGKKTNFLLYIPKKINNELIQGGAEGVSYRKDIRNIRETDKDINEFEKNLMSQTNVREKLDTVKSKKDFVQGDLTNQLVGGFVVNEKEKITKANEQITKLNKIK